jgi:hypothetical protein
MKVGLSGSLQLEVNFSGLAMVPEIPIKPPHLYPDLFIFNLASIFPHLLQQ